MRKTLRLAVPLLLLLPAAPAGAFPALARKYGMSCTACHVAWPIFNQEGQNFRDNGFQLNLGKDDPVTQDSSYLPIAIRITPAYQFTRTTNQPSDQGPITVQQGGVPPPPGVDILTAGTIAKDLSFLVVVSGFSPVDGLAALESAWARIDNIGGTGWLNLKVGKFELDEPASAHRNVTLTAGYAVYGAHPMGSAVGFDMGENQVGLEIDGHDVRSTTRWSVSFTSASGGEGLSGNAWSAPMVYGHVQRAFELDNLVLPWIRVGALGAVGWWPTSFSACTPPPVGSCTGTPAEQIPGTGRNHKQFTRAGAELSWMFGYPSTPLFFTVAWIHGREEAGLASGTDPVTGVDLSTVANSFDGGFLELDWVPVSTLAYNATPWLVFARYDYVRYKAGAGDVDGGTLGVRRYLALGPRGAMAIHAEVHADRTRGVGWVDPATGIGKDVESQSFLLGLDFDY